MKKYLAVTVLLLLSAHLFAQPDNWYFSLTMGGCWPAGTFENKNPATNNAGFATRGFALNLDATYPLGNNWGVKGMVMLNSNPVDRNGMGTIMENRMKKLVPFTEAQRPDLTLTVDSWLSNSLIFGPVYTINFDRVAWDFMAMTGMNVTYLPNQKLLFSNPDNNWDYLQRNTNTINISLDLLAGTAIRMKVTDKVQMKVALDYQYSRSKTSYEELKSTKQNTTVTTVRLGSGNTVVPKDVVIGTIGFVYYL